MSSSTLALWHPPSTASATYEPTSYGIAPMLESIVAPGYAKYFINKSLERGTFTYQTPTLRSTTPPAGIAYSGPRINESRITGAGGGRASVNFQSESFRRRWLINVIRDTRITGAGFEQASGLAGMQRLLQVIPIHQYVAQSRRCWTKRRTWGGNALWTWSGWRRHIVSKDDCS